MIIMKSFSTTVCELWPKVLLFKMESRALWNGHMSLYVCRLWMSSLQEIDTFTDQVIRKQFSVFHNHFLEKSIFAYYLLKEAVVSLLLLDNDVDY